MRILILLLVVGGSVWAIKNKMDSGDGFWGKLGADESSLLLSDPLSDSSSDSSELDEIAVVASSLDLPSVASSPVLPAEKKQVVIVHKFVNRVVPSLSLFQANSGSSANSIQWMVNSVGNQVIARLDEDQAPMIEAMLGAMDIVGNQFRVEAVIGFANISNGEKFSLDWVLKYSEGDRLSFDNHSIQSNPGTINIKTDWLTIAIDRLQESGRLDVVARPSIILSSGETGKISSGREIAVPVSNDQNGNIRNSIEFRRVALTLTVDLTELGSGVEINVNQVSEDVSGETEINGNLIPEIASQVWESRFRPVLGKWYAVGGLKGQEVRKFKQKGLFGFGFRKDESNARREIALLLRVVPAIAESVSPPLALFDPTRIQKAPVFASERRFLGLKLPSRKKDRLSAKRKRPLTAWFKSLKK